jgi:hypothetical protein
MNSQKPYRANFVVMNNDVVPYMEKLPAVSHLDFLRKLEAQLAKDLYPIEWGAQNAEPTPASIIQQLQTAVFILIESHSQSLGQVLYRIDLPEAKIRALMSSTPAAERATVLSGQILEREAKKVWMRMHFSQNSSDSTP